MPMKNVHCGLGAGIVHGLEIVVPDDDFSRLGARGDTILIRMYGQTGELFFGFEPGPKRNSQLELQPTKSQPNRRGFYVFSTAPFLSCLMTSRRFPWM